jgi:RNase H-fold protein (predicted Holliday junction resolvase)
MRILSLDPGSHKCGVAVVKRGDKQPEVLLRRVVAASKLETSLAQWIRDYEIDIVVLGDATTAAAWRARVERVLTSHATKQVAIEMVKEAGSTLEARALYWKENPPRGWRKVLPLSLQSPPEPIDDFAAIVLAQRYFEAQPEVIVEAEA